MSNDMINKKNDEQKDKPDENLRVDVLAHLVIKDKDTDQVIVNKRG